MKMIRRNAAVGAAGSSYGPSCQYNECVDRVTLAASGTGQASLSPQFTKYFNAMQVDATPVSQADANTTNRALVTSVQINACLQSDFDTATDGSGGGILIPDEWQPSETNCLGTPVCWGVFGKSSSDEELQINLLELSGVASYAYIRVTGQGLSALPAGVAAVGARCG